MACFNTVGKNLELQKKKNQAVIMRTIAIKFYLAGIEEYMFSVEMFESSPALLKNE